jgi:hypothetical protein
MRRRRRRGAVAARLAGESRVCKVRPDRLKPSHSVDERATVAVSRRVVPFQNLRDGFKGASRLRFGTREPAFHSPDHRIERVRSFAHGRRLRRSRVSSRNSFEPSGGRDEPIVLRSVVLPQQVHVQARVVGNRLVEPIVNAHAGAPSGLYGGVAGPPAHARDVPRHRSIHVVDRRSKARESPGERRRRRETILSVVVVKKGLKTASSTGPRARPRVALLVVSTIGCIFAALAHSDSTRATARES